MMKSDGSKMIVSVLMTIIVSGTYENLCFGISFFSSSQKRKWNRSRG